MRVFHSISRICICLSVILSCQKDMTGTQDDAQETDGPQIRIAIIGDSISTFHGFLPSDSKGYDGEKYSCFYPRGDVKSVKNTWWYKTAALLGIDVNNITNCSWSGSRVTGDSASTANAYAGCSSRRISDLSFKGYDPDFIICYISCNDWASNVPIGNWSDTDNIPEEGTVSTLREAYALMLHKAKKAFPGSTVICLTNLEDTKRDKTPGWPSNNTNGISVEEWNKNIKEVSGIMGCHTIDLQDSGINYNNVSSYTIDDGLHPNNAGMTLIANLVAKEIKSLLYTQVDE